LESVPQVIEETYNNVKEKLRKLGLDEYIDQLTSAKEDLVEWIKGISVDLKQKLEMGVRFTGRKGITRDIETLSHLANLKTYIILGKQGGVYKEDLIHIKDDLPGFNFR